MATIKQRLEWAFQNEDDPTAKEYIRRYQDGLLNPELEKAGMKPLPVKQPKIDVQATIAEVQQAPGLQSALPDGTTRIEDVGTDLQQGLSELQQVVPERGEKFLQRSERPDPLAVPGMLAQGLGAFLDTAGIVAMTTAKAALTPDQEAQFKRGLDKTLEIPAIKSATDFVSNLTTKIQEENPRLAEILEDAGIFAEFAVGGSKPVREGVEATVEATKRAGKVGADVGKQALDLGVKQVEGVQTKVGEVLEARRSARIEANRQTVDNVVGRIIQGKPEDIAQAKRALSTIDTTHINSFKGLGEAMNDQVGILSTKLDEILEAETGTFSRQELANRINVEKSGVKSTVFQNSVDDALVQLQDFYNKTGNVVEAEKINILKGKLDSDGLNLKEINDIARQHGRDLNAFNASGELASGLSKQSAESTRKGLKTTVRDRIEGELPKALDSQISDLLQTSVLVGKMEEKVNNLFQKVKKRGLLKRIAQSVGTGFDVATFGTVSGFVSRLLPSQVGLKTMNALDIESELMKNLKTLDKLTDDATDDAIIKAVMDIIENNQK
jgi:hypothetical protein